MSVDFPPPPSIRNVRRKPREGAPSEAPPSIAGSERDSGNVRVRVDSIAPPPPPTAMPGPAKRKGESRGMRAFWTVAGFAMVVGIGGGAAWAARQYVKTSPRFAVADIVTTGGKRRTADELAATAGVVKGQNIFSTDLDKARSNLLADPWISEASLTRQLPGTVFVNVIEREAAGLVVSGGDTYIVTREGTVIKRIEAGDPTDFDVVTGVAVQQLVDDREGATRTIRRALDLAFDYEHSPLAQRSLLQEVHVEPNGEMTLVIGKSAVMLHMGAAPYKKKLDQAVRVVAELDRRGAKPDEIMLDNEARPDRVVVRMR